mmetsp:Transcript_5238/g.6100  ORF Transcript_5238/g.6100 Transcript_5238/m.6100 type:complete len:110 (+) Transcript_5238:95-424(+)
MANSVLTSVIFLLALCFTQLNAFAPTASLPTTTELGVKILVEVEDGEPIESALRRFKREVNKSQHLREMRHRRYFENKQDKMKRKHKEMGQVRKFERMQNRRQREQLGN